MDTPLILIDPNSIEFDEKNPRGETPEEIESDLEFRKLKKSVECLGFLLWYLFK